MNKQKILKEIINVYIQFCTKAIQRKNYEEFEKFENYASMITEKLNKIAQVDSYKQNSMIVSNRLSLLRTQKKFKEGFELSKTAFVEFKNEMKLPDHILENLELLMYFSFFSLSVENASTSFQYNSMALSLLNRAINPRLFYEYKGLMNEILVFGSKNGFNAEKKDTFLLLILGVFFTNGICFLELQSYKKAMKMLGTVKSINIHILKDEELMECIETLVSKTKVKIFFNKKIRIMSKSKK